MTAKATTAIVLCGGRAGRFGGADKPLLDLAGTPLVGHVIERLRPQVEQLVLACRANTTRYERFGCVVTADDPPDEGPLGGIVSALSKVTTPWVLTTPADTPFLPANLVAALAESCQREGAAVVVAGGRRQNLAMLLDARRAASLAAFFHCGQRAAHRWLDANRVPEVEMPIASFLNVNTAEDLAAARERAEGGQTRRSAPTREPATA